MSPSRNFPARAKPSYEGSEPSRAGAIQFSSWNQAGVFYIYTWGPVIGNFLGPKKTVLMEIHTIRGVFMVWILKTWIYEVKKFSSFQECCDFKIDIFISVTFWRHSNLNLTNITWPIKTRKNPQMSAKNNKDVNIISESQFSWNLIFLWSLLWTFVLFWFSKIYRNFL